MPRIACENFDEFVAALPRLRGQYVLRTPQSRDWRLRTVDLGGVTLAIGREGASRVHSGVGQEGYFQLFLLLSRRFATFDGARFDRSHTAWVAPGRMFHTVTYEPISWLNITLPADRVLGWARMHEGEFDRSLLDRNVQSSLCRSAAPLVRLARRLFRLDTQSPELLLAPAAERAAQREVVSALFRTLPPVGTAAPKPRCSMHQIKILQRALQLLDTLDTDVIHTDDLCVATDASERTVRNVFNDYVGMSPHRYLMGRRLNAIRSAIRQAGPEDTITSICSRFGVWDLGRFAKQYKANFGVLPSQSLYDCKRQAAFRRSRRSSIAPDEAARKRCARVLAE